MKKKWWKESVVYQIYPRSFKDSNGDGIGDLQGVVEKLDYLKRLGIDVIWLCPIYKSPNDDNGYDISDYQDILDEFGTMEDFEKLLDEAHKQGIKVIMDLVINHTSDEHPWFIESRSSRENSKRDWYIWRDGKDGKEPNNWKSIFEGSTWEYDEKTGQYYFHLFSKKQPDLNWENKEVRDTLKEMVCWWLDKGIDGFRIDAISHIKKQPGFPDMPNPDHLDYVDAMDYTRNVEGIDEWLSDFSKDTFKKYDIMTVGEANGVTIDDADRWVGEENGYMNMIFQFEHLSLWDKEVKKPLDVVALKKILSKWQKGLENVGWNALFLENHDQPRSVSNIGNDRVYWKESAKMLGALYFFMQGTPFIYQGQEIGMTNVKFANIEDYDDISMRNFYKAERAKGRPHEEIMEVVWNRSRDNSRTPMQWNAGPMAGFTTAGKSWLGLNENYVYINVEQQENDPDSILNFYKQMIRIRKENELFMYGTYDLLYPEDPKLFVYTRTLGEKQAIIICNFSEEKTVFTCPAELREKESTLLLKNYPEAESELSDEILLNPYETRVYELKIV
ncbi:MULTISPECIES: alpha-glucosidase [Bacillaceae]|uniref:glycoside hydrolase family 13 protein n=1 Tax=Bacillaceae TaxID=186817 RepID=UPI00203AC97E|nr:alpha-glucosidase [Caldibacillus thermoamylovorans]MCM3054470.1 alpha-glucosidase [Caldibacillus thermoamylovorans]